MRHSRFAQSYQYSAPSIEVTEAEMQDRRTPKGWTCQTIAEMNIPHADWSEAPRTRSTVQPLQAPTKSRRLSLVRRSPSVSDAHRITIQRNVTRRMQAAKERGDQKLLCALEAELREMVSA
ncbi:hypothetical protein [Leptolyngbya sp. FACHB-17]|uniref:hypothetical protein n=1 Tax=unclassified Leptolyngbya TaxID=2650499 RepID=UPI001680CABB|nr:hypothetical protein [Leptolyngbya sp. FACHB-17]MBD2081541.1 hypothetical protein [Leptolyngbya sp. FACHB-17]